MPDPFTAAVAAAVTGSSAAQAEYYQAYQQYYQQYYASQYAAQFYGVSSSGDSVTAVTSGISATAGNLSTTVTSGSQGGDPTVQQQAVLDATASALYARALARAQSMGSLEYSPDHSHFSNECSLFVGELTEDVDDLALFNAFKKYPTCRSAKVVMTNGKSRGYGFVRFLTEADMDKALIEMQNYCGLGYKPIRVSLAIPKRYNADGSLAVTTSTTETTTSVVPSGMLVTT
ncbi:hypothetical protein AHF37_07600 [Paragonimus kellicotti]|nr:hypothetical protein AHF37_07600 [Paragonimus kellicotti]